MNLSPAKEANPASFRCPFPAKEQTLHLPPPPFWSGVLYSGWRCLYINLVLFFWSTRRWLAFIGRLIYDKICHASNKIYLQYIRREREREGVIFSKYTTYIKRVGNLASLKGLSSRFFEVHSLYTDHQGNTSTSCTSTKLLLKAYFDV